MFAEMDMDIAQFLLLLATGLLAGFIDSIAGGGGLITVPVWTLLLGPGSLAIGTNKVAAVFSSLVALLVYMRAGHVAIKGHLMFAVIAGLSSAIGALISPHIPQEAYRWLLITICPVILWIVYEKDLWVKKDIEEHAPHRSNPHRLWAMGFLCGVYDGIAGPGGGTLMFLSLLLVARAPLLTAMATAKLANLSSASVSLASFAATGFVDWTKGGSMAIGIATGALVGATFATKRAAPLARAALLIVASLLLLRLLFA